MTCFQILNYDAWDWVMLDGMRAIGWGASFYFIMWIIVGALVLRNLLLVIILETYVIVSQTISRGSPGCFRAVSGGIRQTPLHPPPCCATVAQRPSNPIAERDRDQRDHLCPPTRAGEAALRGRTIIWRGRRLTDRRQVTPCFDPCQEHATHL